MNIVLMRLNSWVFNLDPLVDTSILLFSPCKVRILQLLLSEKIHLDVDVDTTSIRMLLSEGGKLHSIYSRQVVVRRVWPALGVGIKRGGCC